MSFFKTYSNNYEKLILVKYIKKNLFNILVFNKKI